MKKLQAINACILGASFVLHPNISHTRESINLRYDRCMKGATNCIGHGLVMETKEEEEMRKILHEIGRKDSDGEDISGLIIELKKLQKQKEKNIQNGEKERLRSLPPR